MAISHLTFLLSWDTGDSCLDAAGNIAVASAPYAIAQDVATALSTFLGECWYDNSLGVPYWQSILGQRPTASFVASQLESQALTVPDVATAQCSIGGIDSKRGLIGQMLVTDTDGNETTLQFNGCCPGPAGQMIDLYLQQPPAPTPGSFVAGGSSPLAGSGVPPAGSA
jgi:hypothetical protein